MMDDTQTTPEGSDEFVKARVHRYLPEMCDFWPRCDKQHAGPESLDSFPLYRPSSVTRTQGEQH